MNKTTLFIYLIYYSTSTEELLISVEYHLIQILILQKLNMSSSSDPRVHIAIKNKVNKAKVLTSLLFGS